MKFLLLCPSDSMWPLLRAIHSDGENEILGWLQPDQMEAALRAEFPRGRTYDGVDTFLRLTVDATVVVGNVDGWDGGSSMLRDLARDSVPLIMMQPACSAILAVELDMIQRDTGALMMPIHVASLHPLMRTLQSWSRDSASSPVGPIEQLVMERTLLDRSDVAVRKALAQDALLFRELMGEFRQISALQPGEDTSLANLSVHLNGASDAIGRWSVSPPAESDGGALLTLIGQTGRVSVRISDDENWSMSSTAGEVPTVPEFEAQQVLSDCLQAVNEGRATGGPNWEDAFRCIDLAELAGESLRRKKTLTVNNERLTEEDTFKSLMAAGGCLIILVLPFILLMLTLVDGLRIPISKQHHIDVATDQRTVYLPTDVATLDGVYLNSPENALRNLSMRALRNRYAGQTGTPEAFAVQGDELTLAPIPDQDLRLRVDFKGTFTITMWWPILLGLPLALFLMLQLFKLVFPKPAAAD